MAECVLNKPHGYAGTHPICSEHPNMPGKQILPAPVPWAQGQIVKMTQSTKPFKCLVMYLSSDATSTGNFNIVAGQRHRTLIIPPKAETLSLQLGATSTTMCVFQGCKLVWSDDQTQFTIQDLSRVSITTANVVQSYAAPTALYITSIYGVV